MSVEHMDYGFVDRRAGAMGMSRAVGAGIAGPDVADMAQELADKLLGGWEICSAFATAYPDQDGAHALVMLASALHDAGRKAEQLARSLEC